MTSTKTKSAIILTITFIVGMAVGFFINTMLVKSKFEKFTRMRKPGGVEAMMLERLHPTEEQRPIIQDILKRFKIRMDELRREAFADLDNLKDSLFAELKPVLTEEQYKEMTERFFNPDQRFKPHGDERWRRGEMQDGGLPPPPDMPPPGMDDDRPMPPPDMDGEHERPTPPKK